LVDLVELKLKIEKFVLALLNGQYVYCTVYAGTVSDLKLIRYSWSAADIGLDSRYEMQGAPHGAEEGSLDTFPRILQRSQRMGPASASEIFTPWFYLRFQRSKGSDLDFTNRDLHS
jgi:hypothetical protein